MKRVLTVFVACTLWGTASSFPQTAVSPDPVSGLSLLEAAAGKVSTAKVYYISVAEERTDTNEFGRSWQKTVLKASEMPGNRYFFEGGSQMGRALTVADGTTVWRYRVSEHRYTAKAQPPGALQPTSRIAMSENAMMQAEMLHHSLASLAKPFHSAERMPDESLRIDGHKIQCEVVRVRSADLKRTNPDYSFVKTIWIDKKQQTVVRTVERSHGYLMSGIAHLPLDSETTRTYIVDLNGPAHEDLARFSPPPGATRVEDFPDPEKDFGGPDLAGTPAPALKLKSNGGEVISLDSFRGKPVLLDFWATWCGPCVAALPQLAEIDREARGTNLVLLAIDRDEEADKAAAFLTNKGYTWRNFHDGDGSIEKMVGTSGIPRYLLIDAGGKVVYDATGTDENALRAEIAKLGPQYAALAPKPKQNPCVASK
jgi:thiol-disulfide isomerase/thioredoxin